MLPAGKISRDAMRVRRALAEKGSLLPHTTIRLPHETSYPSGQGVSAVWAISEPSQSNGELAACTKRFEEKGEENLTTG
jgi:hypothetical protein